MWTAGILAEPQLHGSFLFYFPSFGKKHIENMSSPSIKIGFEHTVKAWLYSVTHHSISVHFHLRALPMALPAGRYSGRLTQSKGSLERFYRTIILQLS